MSAVLARHECDRLPPAELVQVHAGLFATTACMAHACWSLLATAKPARPQTGVSVNHSIAARRCMTEVQRACCNAPAEAPSARSARCTCRQQAAARLPKQQQQQQQPGMPAGAMSRWN